MLKLAAMVSSLLVSLGLAAFLPAQPPGPDGPEPPKAKAKAKGKEAAKKKGEPGPAGDLTKAYDLLRRLRASDSSVGRPEERIREWTERATKYYRDGTKALDTGDEFLAHEYGAIAHDLARATDHARNAALLDRRDPELPPPSRGFGPEESGDRVRRDLYHAYERITELSQPGPTPGTAAYYLKAARDLYSAARRDVQAGREERGANLPRRRGHDARGRAHRPRRGWPSRGSRQGQFSIRRSSRAVASTRRSGTQGETGATPG